MHASRKSNPLQITIRLVVDWDENQKGDLSAEAQIVAIPNETATDCMETYFGSNNNETPGFEPRRHRLMSAALSPAATLHESARHGRRPMRERVV